MSSPKTTVVLVSYRSLGTIDAALRSTQEAVERGEAKVVVVDNHGQDGTAEHVSARYPFVELRRPGKNLGFGKGCNHGAAGATTPYLLFLNPDATLSRDALTALVSFLEQRPKVGIAAPYIEGHRVGAVSTPLDVVRRSVGLERRDVLRDVEPTEAPFPTSWVSGAAFLMRRDVFERLEGFDPRFFLYFEETDLCVRCHRLGYEIWVVPSAHATHQAGASTTQIADMDGGQCIPEFYYESRFYYLRKHHGALAAIAADGAELATLVARAVASRVGLRDRSKASGLGWRLRGSWFRAPSKE